jgi:hypothetical protein
MPTCFESALRLPAAPRCATAASCARPRARGSRLVEVEAAAFQARDDGGKVFSEQLDIEHVLFLANFVTPDCHPGNR